ncbi:MAG: NAD-dependent malic enzyme [Syntrophaceae bacterium]|nr:NAD-dependent malic enzyme [Syntrophaceae bacterium]
MIRTTSPSYSILLRLEIPNRPGMLARVLSAIGRAGGNIGSVDIAGFRDDAMIRDIVVNAADSDMLDRVTTAVRKVREIRLLHVTDRTFMLHAGGKIEIKGRLPLKTRADLSMAYTPGVARVSMAIHEEPDRVFDLTMKKNMVAIVTDGTAVLGLGDIGPRAALPVMEGKALLFKEFGGVNAFPICLDTKDPEEIVQAVKWIAPGFGGVNLEDISAPRCFEIEDRLKAELDIPVFHDDQHGTAVVILAGLTNALKIVGKRLANIRIVVNGLGAAGIATTRLLLAAGAKNIVGCDRAGALYRGRKENMNPVKEEIASLTNPEQRKGSLRHVLEGADVFIGVSQGNILPPSAMKRMGPDPVVFVLANPVPEIAPEAIHKFARIIATGRSDYPNQVNNVLCFPGLFRGVLDSRARSISREMLLAAADAIAGSVAPRELSEDHIIPGVFNRKVQEEVAKAVTAAAVRTGSARPTEFFLAL